VEIVNHGFSRFFQIAKQQRVVKIMGMKITQMNDIGIKPPYVPKQPFGGKIHTMPVIPRDPTENVGNIIFCFRSDFIGVGGIMLPHPVSGAAFVSGFDKSLFHFEAGSSRAFFSIHTVDL
jgi:hypothetical protein